MPYQPHQIAIASSWCQRQHQLLVSMPDDNDGLIALRTMAGELWRRSSVSPQCLARPGSTSDKRETYAGCMQDQLNHQAPKSSKYKFALWWPTTLPGTLHEVCKGSGRPAYSIAIILHASASKVFGKINSSPYPSFSLLEQLQFENLAAQLILAQRLILKYHIADPTRSSQSALTWKAHRHCR